MSKHRFTTSFQTHTNQSIATNATNASGWTEVRGFYDISITLANDAATASIVNLYWSNDGIATHGADMNALPSGTDQYRAVRTGCKGRYVKVEVKNGDAATHVFNVYAHLTT